MTEPITLIGLLKTALESIHSFWKNGALLLWSLAFAALVAFLVIDLADHFGLNGAVELKRDYGLYLLLASVVIGVFAVFKTYAERANRPLILIANEQNSLWVKQSNHRVRSTIKFLWIFRRPMCRTAMYNSQQPACTGRG
jgi:hypothetical protein